MDFTLTAEQQAIAEVARQLFDHRATPERLTELEAADVRFDSALWKELVTADLLGIALPESVGGSGQGFLELCVLLVEAGRAVAPVPVYAGLLLGADSVARHGDDGQIERHLSGVATGDRILTAALSEPDVSRLGTPTTRATPEGSNWRLTGSKDTVPAAQLAHAILVPASTEDGDIGLFLVDSSATGVDVRPVSVTSGEPCADLQLDGVVVPGDDMLGRGSQGANLMQDLYTRGLIGLCALQLGVSERAMRIAAGYTSEREQFGRPIGTFQAVQQRMADAFIDVEAIRWTMWHAAWRVATSRSAEREASIAKFWAAEAGARVAATAQQVHGGIGIDITYPLFRYFLATKQHELALGPASMHLAEIGRSYTKGSRSA